MARAIQNPAPFFIFLKKLIKCCFVPTLIFSFLLLLPLQSRVSAAEIQRKALVIGNAAYKNYPLKNPVNDATGMANALKKNGFQVTLLKNAGQRKMEEAIHHFGRQLQRGDVGLFYFAGHGIQHKGRNYLIPVNARILDEADVKYKAVDAGTVLSKMELAGNDVNIVILDACRNNPFARNFRSIERRGLVQMSQPTGSLVAYSTAPGSVSEDGRGKHGIYTGFLLEYMNKPGLTIEQVFKQVRKSVRKKTGNRQVPWENSSLTGNFYFAGPGVPKMEVKKAGSVSPATGSIRITTEPENAKIWIDEGYEGYAPLEIADLKPGLIVVKAGKNGYWQQKEKVRIRAGRQSILNLQLQQIKQLPGKLYVRVIPSGSRIKLINSTIQYRDGIELAPGVHRIEASRTGYLATRRQVEIVPGKDLRITITLQRIKQLPVDTGIGDRQKLQVKKKQADRQNKKTVTATKPATSRLTVLPDPWNAQIKILNITPVYHPGMELPPGRYHLEVSHSAYQTLYKWIDLPAHDKTFSITLVPLQRNPQKNSEQGQQTAQTNSSDKGQNSESGRLTIVPVPWNARVRILNIQPVYQPAIKLPAGRYHVEVSHPGFRTATRWLELGTGENLTNVIKLKRLESSHSEQSMPVLKKYRQLTGRWKEVTSNEYISISHTTRLTVMIRWGRHSDKQATQVSWNGKTLKFNEQKNGYTVSYRLNMTGDATLVGYRLSAGKKVPLIFTKK